MKVRSKPIKTPHHSFPRPREKTAKHEVQHVVCKINCLNCDIVYYRQTGRAINSLTEEVC